MHQPYSAWADWLSKFHMSSEWIQMLWLIAVPLTLLGLASLLVRLVKEVILLPRRRFRGRLLYGVYEGRDGRDALIRDRDNHPAIPGGGRIAQRGMTAGPAGRWPGPWRG